MITDLLRQRCGFLSAIVVVVLGILFTETGRAASPAATWTKGHKKILVIPVRFTDATGPTNSDVYGITGWNSFTNGTMQAEINSFFARQSYNQLSVDFTILPEINLGVSTNYYTNTLAGTPYTKWTE